VAAMGANPDGEKESTIPFTNFGESAFTITLKERNKKAGR
jgi:hypothetical protein